MDLEPNYGIYYVHLISALFITGLTVYGLINLYREDDSAYENTFRIAIMLSLIAMVSNVYIFLITSDILSRTERIFYSISLILGIIPVAVNIYNYYNL